MSHIPTVQAMYAAFGQGNVPGVLEHLTEDVAWEYEKASTDIPWLVPRRGRAEVPKFFAALSEGIDLRKFAPKTLLESGPVVVALIDVELLVKATGRLVVEDDEVHIFHFDAQGKVSRFCHKVDTHRLWLAMQ